MNKVLILITVFISLNINVYAQVIIGSGDSLFQNRIKLVESFMNRFNNRENLIGLFDSEMLGAEKDSVYKAAQQFAKDATKSGAKLNFADTSWFAIATCAGKYKGKSVNFILILNVETYGKDLYKWVVAKAQGDFFSLTPPKNDNTLITPLAHETNFMELSRIKAESILSVSQKRYELDQTAVFYTMINSGLLNIEYVSELQFLFLQLPGWIFTIKEFERQTYNAGWLITSFERINDKEKYNLLNNLYNEK